MTEEQRAAVRFWRTHWRTQAWRARAARDDAEPWSLPIVVRVERERTPSHQQAMYASALAVVRLLADPAATPDCPWHEPLQRWADGRIRKVVRRARGSRWLDVAALPGVTATVDDAEVRALLPHPVSDVPPPVGKLQVEGLDLDVDPDRSPGRFPLEDVGAEAAGGPTLTIVLAPRLAMSTGKACAQVGHAAQLGLLELDAERVFGWVDAGFPLRIVEATRETWRGVVGGEVEAALVTDAGYTEVEPGTHTCASTFAELASLRP
ncbi:peptidyl-tRNA hydrolase [Actinopolymorpha sp. B11F2]|uniref:peptidyl-tRNA hydrolase n=1 Tax=Actinopolymorpha sp. B11F2 TaxID=3160862 RepID=UPI0032E3C0C7